MKVVNLSHYLSRLRQAATALSVLLLAMQVSSSIAGEDLAPENLEQETLRLLADRYLAATLTIDPSSGYFSGIEMVRHDQFLENNPALLAQYHRLQDRTLATLVTMQVGSWQRVRAQVFHAKFVEALEAARQSRVCRQERWNINHMFGAHLLAPMILERQPVRSSADEAAALVRLKQIANYFLLEPANLEKGVHSGHTAAKTVAQRVLNQVKGILEKSPIEHPYMLSDGKGREQFRQQYADVLRETVDPALAQYAEYLEKKYIPRTRSERAVSRNTDGRACYEALYRRWTSIQRAPEEVHAVGLAEVRGNEAEIVVHAGSRYGTIVPSEIITAAGIAANTFDSTADYAAALNSTVINARKASAQVFRVLPESQLVVEPLATHAQGTGVSAHYLPPVSDAPAKFIYDPTTFDNTSMAEAEILSVHEGYPGHHLQIGLALAGRVFHPLEKLFRNSAYVEGWARYAESLAEELGVYQNASTPILRRAWPARGMVLDTGMHILGWSDTKLIEFLKDSGRQEMIEDHESILDRMAMMPAQLTAYDSGALAIRSLRERVEAKLGKQFLLTEFHDLILRDGAVPIAVLEQRVDAYLASRSAAVKGRKTN